MDSKVIYDVFYLLAAILFILGVKLMAHPRTARRGNMFGILGMTIAIVISILSANEQLVYQKPFTLFVIGLCCLIGILFGGILATRVKMTEMPQLVAVFNGIGGLASVLVAGAALVVAINFSVDEKLATGLSGFIGSITFIGSAVAAGKLQELKFFKKDFPLPTFLRHLINLALVLSCGWAGYALLDASPDYAVLLYVVICSFGFILGYTLTAPIGGADMPVVIALLNSYSGLAASATGFVVGSNILIIAGSLVGASGIILTSLMCVAMNRSLLSVLFGGGKVSVDVDADLVYATVKRTTADDVAMMADMSERVVIVPGYGMAVAQAQNAVSDMAEILEKRGVTVEYAIHPVAGRMPGHMNVLLAEADVGYEQLKELEEINPTFDTVDLAIVLGANDVVNPEARKEGTVISGMPILDVDKAQQVVIIKRSLGPGYAGIPNPLFAQDNATMLFGDGRDAIQEIIAALKDL